MASLNEEISQLKQQVAELQSKVDSMSENVEDKTIPPYSKVEPGKKHEISADPGTGAGAILAFNDTELKRPPLNQQPAEPTRAFNSHGHSRYAGGALDIRTLELVEYDSDENNNVLDSEGNILNKHTQQFWTQGGKIKTVENVTDGNSEFVPKIGKITDNMVFDPDTGQWRFYAVYKDEPDEE